MAPQAHAKRVAAENKRTRRFALGGGFGGGRLRATRPKMGNSRGMVVKAFAADSDDEEESDQVTTTKKKKSRGFDFFVPRVFPRLTLSLWWVDFPW